MRVVLVRLSALGDIVHTWPLAAALRSAAPDLRLTWVVEEPLRPMVEGHPAVDEALVVRTRSWRTAPWTAATRAEIREFQDALRRTRADLVLDAQGVAKSAVIVHWSRARDRIGLARPWRRELLAGLVYTGTLAGSVQRRHVVATNLELVRAVGATPPAEPPAPDGRWLLDKAASQAPQAPGTGPCCVILPGAGRHSKVVPVPTLAAAARSLLRTGLHVVVAWGPGERQRATAVAETAGGGVALAPPTGLLELTHLLGSADLVVGGDTGPIHLAASLGTPTVGVYIATDPERNGPLGDAVRVVSAARSNGARPTGSSWARQVRTVGADEIVAAARELLGEGPGSRPTPRPPAAARWPH
jgi:heptosyltransferase-1